MSSYHRRVRRFAFACAVLGAAFALEVPGAWAFPWDIDMYRGAPIQPLEVAPRVMPAGTIPSTGGEPPMTREYMTANEHNPLDATPENLAAGKTLFTTVCAPCHGDNGEGHGPVAHLLKTKPDDLAGGASKDRPDGYIYGTIRDGTDAMPSYDDAMSAHERWQVVLFVRSLQQAKPVAEK